MIRVATISELVKSEIPDSCQDTVVTENENREHRCERCNKHFANEVDLRKHKCKRLLKYNFCNTVFQKLTSFIRHRFLKHGNDIDYQCKKLCKV